LEILEGEPRILVFPQIYRLCLRWKPANEVREAGKRG
jgi:hypothetical protein